MFIAWREFRKGKRNKSDVQQFVLNLEDNIFVLHNKLMSGRYRCGKYYRFLVNDPKPRIIHKAPVRDRLLHHAIYRILYPLYDKTFIYDSYSCRVNKGTHRAFARLIQFTRAVSNNYSQTRWALKCDIRKFFDSIDHQLLLKRLSFRVGDKRLLHLLELIIDSFGVQSGRGIPLGNLTSQLFANIYLDPLDKFIKHKLRLKYYLRYADDLILLSANRDELTAALYDIRRFVQDKLLLELHPNKISLRKLQWGIDFVGYVALPHYCLPRKKTIARIVKSVRRNKDTGNGELASYLGYLGHTYSKKKQHLLREFVSN